MDQGEFDGLLDEQRRYYRERADEYDDWWERRGRYDNGPERTAAWRAEIGVVADWLVRCRPRGTALELAAGTGNWTRHLAPLVDRLVAVDASAETLAIAATKLPVSDLEGGRVELRVGDVFAFESDEVFDTVFFSFWLTHVPDSLVESFWALVARSLAPGGQVLFVDNAPPSFQHRPGALTLDVHYAAGADDVDRTSDIARRTLADGRQFRIVKRFGSGDAREVPRWPICGVSAQNPARRATVRGCARVRRHRLGDRGGLWPMPAVSFESGST